MNRVPPAEVRRVLRREVGFGCPIQDCGNPYLYWHHFDPPWHKKEHHDPHGMIALCAKHHAKAEAGAYTKEQLRSFKQQASERSVELRGRFEWMRNELLARVGGGFYHETPIILELQRQPVIWFNRDENDYWLLNIRMPTVSGEPRIHIEDNFWIESGNPSDLVCPPSGRLIIVSYKNGDTLKVEFLELQSVASVMKRYHEAEPKQWSIQFPITAVEIYMKIAGTPIEFNPEWTSLPYIIIRNSFVSHCRVGISLNL